MREISQHHRVTRLTGAERERSMRLIGIEEVGASDHGIFNVRVRGGDIVTCLATTGLGWDHVSVSLPRRTPTWHEMDAVKRIFFAPDEVVMQIHPAESDHINMHPHCLHLWRPSNDIIPLPPKGMV
jgi:hypothetical protein